MTPFTTSKGDFIAVPVPEKAHTFTNDLASHQIDFILDTKFRDGKIGFSDCVILRDCWGQSFEIIGLSSAILKDEELAKKVLEEVQYTESKGVSIWYPLYGFDKVQIGDKLLWNEMCKESNLSFASLMSLNNITGNNLIIKKK